MPAVSKQSSQLTWIVVKIVVKIVGTADLLFLLFILLSYMVMVMTGMRDAENYLPVCSSHNRSITDHCNPLVAVG